MKKTLLIIAFILWASGADARTFYIAKSGDGGSDSNSCAQAQNRSTPKLTYAGFMTACGSGTATNFTGGDTLYFRRGTYNEKIDTNQAHSGYFVISGASSGNRAVIAGDPADGHWQVIINGNSSDSCVVALGGFEDTTSPYLTFQNLIIDGLNRLINDGPGCDVLTISSDNIRFDDVWVRNGLSGWWTAEDIPGSSILVGIDSWADGVEFLNSSFSGKDQILNPVTGAPHGGYGFYWRGTNGLMDNCDVFDNDGYGVHMFNSLSDSVSNNTIRNSRFWNNQNRGAQILIGNGSNNKVYNNIIRDGNGSYNGSYGIQVDFRCTNCLIANNLIENHSTGGIEISAANGPVSVDVVNNILVSSGSTPFILWSSPTFDANHNICANNGTCEDYVSGGIVGSGTSLTDASATYPRFVDPANNDFRLCIGAGDPHPNCSAASPAIGEGTDLSGLGITTDIEGTTRANPPSIGPYEGEGSPPPPNPECPVESNDPVARYSFDDHVNDLSANVNHGTPTAITYAAGKYNKAASFNGTSSVVTVPDAEQLFLCRALSIGAWVNPNTSPTDFRGVVTKGADEAQGYILYSSSSGYAGPGAPLGGYFQNGGVHTASHSTPIPQGTWTYLMVRWDGTTITLDIGTTRTTTSSSALIDVSTGDLMIGGTPFGEFFSGLIDNVEIWNRAISDTEKTTAMNTPIEGVVIPSTTPTLFISGTIRFGSGTAFKTAPVVE
jgi:hypothetical protein